MKTDSPSVEGQRLQRYVSNIGRLVALPARWARHETAPIADELVASLFGMLELDFAYLRFATSANDVPIEATRLSQWIGSIISREALEPLLSPWWSPAVENFPSELRLSGHDVRVRSLRLGFAGEMGVLVVGARRPDFPHRTEDVLLNVAANQATIGLEATSRRADACRPDITRGSPITGLKPLVAELAHDLNQPLAGIMINASAGLRMLATDPPNVAGARETARRTIRDTQRASECIGRLRTLCDKVATTSAGVEAEAVLPFLLPTGAAGEN